ncbi:uncharacterized protein LOC116341082 [Contarinia nasturtii]|uniref:uncharacterized protein LOC116341082 n=1 Tax=Contarinia nasturtii TaxID=265458 RepID=UPI0012D46E15|nr:uncharacterized protein LOC116341082 [Contarinia nasturtii]
MMTRWIEVIAASAFVFAVTVAYVVPKARIEVLHPKGFSVSIPDTPGIQLFAFHGNLNSPMEGLENGQFSADILKHKNGRWTFIDRKHEIKPGDVLYYWMYVQKESLGYRRDDQKHEFTDSDVYRGINVTEETSSTDAPEYTERPVRPTQPTRGTSTVNENRDCNASTGPMRVFPSEVHHYHHHLFGPSSCGAGGNGGQFGGQYPNGGSGGSFNGGGGGGGSVNFPSPDGQSAGTTSAVQQLTLQMRQVMAALENMKLKVATLSEVVDELINSNSNTKLLLTGANVDSTTNLFDLVRHIILDRLELKDLKNDIYSATRIKKGIVFDVASGLDKRRILARARERLHGDDEELRITDYYDGETKPDNSESSESIIDTRFGDE